MTNEVQAIAANQLRTIIERIEQREKTLTIILEDLLENLRELKEQKSEIVTKLSTARTVPEEVV